MRVDIATVHKGVNKDFFKSIFLRHLEHCDKVFDVRVNATVADQSEEMKGRVVLFDVGHRLKIFFVGEESSFADCLINQCQRLIDDAAGADVEMADF